VGSLASVREVRAANEWDAFVEAHAQGGFLQSWRWGEIKARYGWRPLRLATPGVGPIEAGVQLLLRVRKLTPIGPRAGAAYIPRGPLAASTRQARDLLAAAVTIARGQGASFVRVEPPPLIAGEALAAEGFRATPRYIQIPRTAVVDLTPSLDALLAGFKPKMRYNIRLAERRGVAITHGRAERDLDAFYRLTQITARREGFAIHRRAYYADVWRAFQPDHATLVLATFEAELLAAVLCVRFGRTAVYLYGASGEAHRELMAPHAAQWAAMRWAKAHGCTAYDLWGMADPRRSTDPMAGVHRFKLGFNPAIVDYPGAFDCAIQPLRAWALDVGVLRARDVFNRLGQRPAAAGP